MTIFAGIYCRTQNGKIPDKAMREIEISISRSETSTVRSFHFEKIFVASVDVGAFRQSGIIHSADEGLTLVVGDPVIRRSGDRWNSDRAEDAQQIHNSFLKDDLTALECADGTFAGLHFNARSQAFCLFIDKIGIRQVFVSITEKFVFFASSLRILERVSEVPKRINTRRLIEEVELPDSLRRRTPYNDVDRMGSAELIRCSGLNIRREDYWKMPAPYVKPDADLSCHLIECHETFRSAVTARLNAETEVTAFLSGGLDSRSIVDRLVELGIKVNTLNFAPPDSQDRVFAQQFAGAIGSVHMQMNWDAAIVDPVNVYRRVKDFLDQQLASGFIDPQRPACIWGGCGGSSILGHVIINKELISELQRGNHRAAAEIYLKAECSGFVPRRLLRRSIFDKFEDWPRQALENEFSEISRENSGREFSNFLIQNHERRSLHNYYETIDVHCIEQLMPFYDAGFLEAVSKVPIESCLYHKFYVEWLNQMSEPVRTIPWQSYPGHVPCPVDAPKHLGYQFDETYTKDLERVHRQTRLRIARELLTDRQFPSNLLNRSTIILAAAFCLIGSSRMGYLINRGSRYCRFTRNATEFISD